MTVEPITEYQVRKLAQQIRTTESLRHISRQISLDTLAVNLNIGAKFLEQITTALDMSEEEIKRYLSSTLAQFIRARLATAETELKQMLTNPAWEKSDDQEEE